MQVAYGVLHLNYNGKEPLRSSFIGSWKHLRNLYLSVDRVDDELLPSISKLQNLQTLKLYRCPLLGFSSCSESFGDIGNMTSLRHIEIYDANNYLFPRFITKRQNLQTLKLRGCENGRLPQDIGNIRSLRHIDLSHSRLTGALPTSITKLENLHTLLLEGIKHLNSLSQISGKLTIRELDQVRDATDAKEANLKKKPYLRSLGLVWNCKPYSSREMKDNDAVTEAENVLERLQPHPNLKELNITGYGGMKFASWMIKSSLLPNLVRIDLWNCTRCESLEFSGPLPSLEYLSLCGLEALKSITSKLRKGDGFFPSLKELELTYMPNLESCSIVIDDDDAAQPQKALPSFPHLPEYWKIRHCPKLESIPWGMPVGEYVILEEGNSAKLLESILRATDDQISTMTSTNSSTSFCPKVRSLRLFGCQNLKAFPQDVTSMHPQAVMRYLTNLEELRIENCTEFTPLESIGGLISLKELVISNNAKTG
ncbi:PREDICTED: putative disease resistance protein RGA1 [Nelumbo nucifera]|uniref:Disease resistance protein RGA1 n=1 Tax=Nelumbo nucifera TaxID=4432 RepID=A0A1U8BFY4_NELNU|nr:PREDICTED: putative disease resistance protein RGA1 [Nelumbo nucifera]